MQTAKFGTSANASTPANNFEDNKGPNNNSIINTTRNFSIQDQNVESNYGNPDVGVQHAEFVIGQIAVAQQQELELKQI